MRVSSKRPKSISPTENSDFRRYIQDEKSAKFVDFSFFFAFCTFLRLNLILCNLSVGSTRFYKIVAQIEDFSGDTTYKVVRVIGGIGLRHSNGEEVSSGRMQLISAE